MQVRTPKERWNDLLRELNAASEELSASFIPLLTARNQADRDESRQTDARSETRRYDDALRRFDAINAKIKAFRAKVRRSRMFSDTR